MLFANVIFPAFSAPYVSLFLFPIAGIATLVIETVIFKIRHKELSGYRVLGFVIVANIVSWMFGSALSYLLPSGLTTKSVESGGHELTIMTQAPNFGTLVIIAFIVAFFLSILIEFFVWKGLTHKRHLSNLFMTTCLAHIASYVTLTLLFLC